METDDACRRYPANYPPSISAGICGDRRGLEVPLARAGVAPGAADRVGLVVTAAASPRCSSRALASRQVQRIDSGQR
jgi:hypothetical protein